MRKIIQVVTIYQGWPKCGPCVKFWMHYLSIFVTKKYPKLTSITSYLKKNKPKNCLRPAIQYLNKIWHVSKKVWPPVPCILLLYLCPCFPTFQMVLLISKMYFKLPKMLFVDIMSKAFDI